MNRNDSAQNDNGNGYFHDGQAWDVLDFDYDTPISQAKSTMISEFADSSTMWARLNRIAGNNQGITQNSEERDKIAESALQGMLETLGLDHAEHATVGHLVDAIKSDEGHAALSKIEPSSAMISFQNHVNIILDNKLSTQESSHTAEHDMV